MAQLRQAKVDASSQVKQLHKRCRDLEAAAHLPIPEIKQGNAGARLREVADAGRTWQGCRYKDPELRNDVDGVLLLLQQAPAQMADWLFSAAFEEARQVLAGVKARRVRYPDVALGPLVR